MERPVLTYSLENQSDTVIKEVNKPELKQNGEKERWNLMGVSSYG